MIKTNIAGVVGDPISHSLSPRLHGYWLKKYHMDDQYNAKGQYNEHYGQYNAFHVTADELGDFLKNLKKNGIKGVNLTVPHKEAALPYMDIIDETARNISAVNTVYFDDDGKLIGANTDGIGFLKHLKQSVKNWTSENKSAMLIGAGGAARAIAVSLLDDGIGEIRLCNRTQQRAENLAGQLADNRVKIIPWQDREKSLKGTDLLINTTILGMTGQAELILKLDHLDKAAIVYDIVYNPLQTKLLSDANQQGNKTVDGLGMLLHQAVPGFKAWFGIEPEIDDDLRQYMLEALS